MTLQAMTTTTRPIATLAATAIIVLVSGCSSKPAAPVFTPDPTAFEYGIKQTAEMQLYVSGCAAVGQDIATLASEAEKSWYERNWAEAQAADEQYSKKFANDIIEYNNEKIALPVVKMYIELARDIARRLDTVHQSHANVAEVCRKRLADYRDGKYDLSQNQNAGLYLKSLASTPAAPHKIPSLAGSIKTQLVPGRSAYDVERNMADLNCANGEMLTLRNEWPYEGYGIFCDGEKTIFISCEWGECKKPQ